MELEWNSKASEISQQRVKIQLSLSTFDISLGNWDGIKFKRWINTKFLNNGAQTRYSRYSSLSPSNWSGIKFEKIFHKTNLTLSINCEKKFGISIPSSNREFNPIQSEGSEGFVTYRSSRFFSIHAGKVKFLRGDVETGVDWQTLFFFLSNKSWRVKVPACIIPSGKVEIIKISNFQTGVRREKTYDWAAWDGQCRGFPYRACELRSNFELGKLETGEKKKKKEKLFPLWCLVASPKNNFLSYDHSTMLAWLRVRGCGLLKGFRDSVFFSLSFFSVREEDLEIVRITESNMGRV